MSDLPRVMTDIVEPWGGTADMIDMAHLTDVVGPSTSSLRACAGPGCFPDAAC
ncbi:MAG: hypothetical protein R3B98_02615 [Hyphomonas sp.]